MECTIRIILLGIPYGTGKRIRRWNPECFYKETLQISKVDRGIWQTAPKAKLLRIRFSTHYFLKKSDVDSNFLKKLFKMFDLLSIWIFIKTFRRFFFDRHPLYAAFRIFESSRREKIGRKLSKVWFLRIRFSTHYFLKKNRCKFELSQKLLLWFQGQIPNVWHQRFRAVCMPRFAFSNRAVARKSAGSSQKFSFL